MKREHFRWFSYNLTHLFSIIGSNGLHYMTVASSAPVSIKFTVQSKYDKIALVLGSILKGRAVLSPG